MTMSYDTVNDHGLLGSIHQGSAQTDIVCQVNNLCINGTVASGTGTGCLVMQNRGAAPSGATLNTGVLFVESGALWYKGASGTLTRLALT